MASDTRSIWRDMRRRCTNPKSPKYARYGGRGIVMCERWQSFENFLADMGPRPMGLTLERIDNDGPYSPDNCKWATRLEQTLNRPETRWITFGGRTLYLREWAKTIGVSNSTLHYRLSRMPLEDALRDAKP